MDVHVVHNFHSIIPLRNSCSLLISVAPAQAQIIHAGQACVVKEDNISERVYTIREGDTLVLQCVVTGHPRPQVNVYYFTAAISVYPAFTFYVLFGQMPGVPLSVGKDVPVSIHR